MLLRMIAHDTIHGDMHKKMAVGKILWLAVLVLTLVPSSWGAQSTDTFTASGTVQYVDLDGRFWGIVAYDGARYVPLELPQQIKQEGLKVRFTACLAPGVITTAMWGTAIQLVEIRAVVVDRAVVAGQTAFALELFHTLASRKGNLCISPLSIFTALSMTYAGARGETEAQMHEVLRFPYDNQEALHAAVGALVEHLTSPGPAGQELKIANALWIQRGYPFLVPFLELINSYYQAGLEELDFARDAEGARAIINAWVEKHTAGYIRELLAPRALDSESRLVLTNTVYFRGSWQVSFPLESTTPAPFYRVDGTEVDALLMHQDGLFRYCELDELQVLELPYAGGQAAMVLLLPKSGEQLAGLEAALTPELLESWLSVLDLQQVAVWLPAFTATSAFDLEGALVSMGMRAPFSPQADLSGMTGSQGLFISKVAHQAKVEVSEEGTVAAAATAVVMKEKALVAPPSVFRADRPFLFLIRDIDTGLVLFLGRLADPITGLPTISDRA